MNISFNFIKSYLKTSISAFSPIIPLKHLIPYLLVRLIHSLSIDSRWISNFLSKKTQFLNTLFSELLPTLGRLGGGKTSKNGILAALLQEHWQLVIMFKSEWWLSVSKINHLGMCSLVLKIIQTSAKSSSL